jgi:anti-sigma factor RsiW
MTMDYKEQLKLQAYLDGELSEAEARQVAEWVARDQMAAGLLTELRQTREMLTGFEQEVKLPESREFFWSKVQAAIEREERVATPAPAVPLLTRLRRFLVPAAGFAVLALLAIVTLHQPGTGFMAGSETSFEDAQAFTYHDFSARATLVWLTYPPDKTIAGEDEFTIVE